ncbi:MAG: amidohydrolase family protein [Proteobacteria bacterium]|nr:amidohydrolase family protein [Pseudomonadota bacterium]
MRAVDCHAHVFSRECQPVQGARYRPGYDALVQDWMALWPHAQVGRGVLVQPSFLGTDNGYLLRQLGAHRERLRGVAVIAPGVARTELLAWSAMGVCGIRLNLIGKDELGVYALADWQSLFRNIADLGWHVEIQCEGERVTCFLAALGSAPPALVFDHFGLPDPNAGGDCPGMSAIVREAEKRTVFVKLSAPYRMRGADARSYAGRYLAELGPERLLWGSDWPWTNHEADGAYKACGEWLESWIPSAAARKAIMWDTPSALYQFDA